MTGPRLYAQEGKPHPAASTAKTGPGQFHAEDLREPISLAATWAVHGGDDPAYALPAFDDSAWTPFNSDQSLHQVFPKEPPAIVWYRLHIRLAPDQRALALEEVNLSSAFEIYANGRRILQVGSVSPYAGGNMAARLLALIPDDAVNHGDLVLALRVYVSKTDWGGPRPGFYSNNLQLGRESELRQHLTLTLIGKNGFGAIIFLFSMVIGIVALALYLIQKNQREYLWICLLLLTVAGDVPLVFLRLTRDLPAIWHILDSIFFACRVVFLAFVFFAFMRQRVALWINIFLIASAVLLEAADLASALGYLPGLILGAAALPCELFMSVVIPAWLILHWRRGNREAAILLIPAAFNSAAFYAEFALISASFIPALRQKATVIATTIIGGFQVGPFTIDVFDFANLLLICSLAAIMLRRSLEVSRQQAVFQTELAAAREVQRVILPEQTGVIPGFAIETAYLPAQQVGGDFFQVLPLEESQGGGLLLVLGDVAGKGLPAAMLVSVLVGAIRTIAEFTSSPANILASLNERLVGRTSGGFSTALAARIDAEGTVTIANAGHLSPYLDGREVALPGALPLGIVSGAGYESTSFHLAPGSRLTFYSDGVIEAQNAQNELLGFERGREISTQPAAAIMEIVKRFGQSDDITIVAVAWRASIAAAA